MKENTINLNEIDLNNQTALSILTAASKAIAYEEDTVNIDLMPIVIKSFPSSRELFFWELIPVSSLSLRK